MADRVMDSPDAWQEAWIKRTQPLLFRYSVALTYMLSGISLLLGIRSLLSLRRYRKEIDHDPSSRAALFVACDRQMLKATRRQYMIACVFSANFMAIWLVDAGILVGTLWKDAETNPGEYNASHLLGVAMQVVSMLCFFLFVFFVFPMIQVVACSWAFAKYRTKNNTDGTLAAYVPEARVLSTHLSQLWMMAGFFVMAFWPVFSQSPIRFTLLEALWGSHLAWSHIAYMLNWRSQEISNIELTPRMGVQDAVRLCGQHGIAFRFRKSPQHILPVSEEKQALLGESKP